MAARIERSAARARARAIGIAAVRETFEETGLVLGHLEGDHLVPDLHDLEFVARAITPSFNPIRYHARFLLADGEYYFEVGDMRSSTATTTGGGCTHSVKHTRTAHSRRCAAAGGASPRRWPRPRRRRAAGPPRPRRRA